MNSKQIKEQKAGLEEAGCTPSHITEDGMALTAL
jgi:hypothetical protein